MKFIPHKNCFNHSNRFTIGLIICVLMLAPFGHIFANTVACVDDASSSMDMTNDDIMDAEMDCCAEVDMCKTSCDLSMFCAPVLLDSTDHVSISKPASRFSIFHMDFLPFLPPPPLIRPPVSV